ncbi:MAG: bifunctional glutamate N-acetyltransferase/amino-acid acetyltransferase ArgJ [Candidatus Omnitrophica bacterium]|nr:bifunctional glutamate N-acetyltransferase/amino-acid acetyltransferase ArgJ [Candidatus Omnitrophota bacterium]
MESGEWVPGGVTAPKGFQAAGIACGIKKRKKDLALIYSKGPAVAAGVFTANRLQAAPVLVTKEHIRSGTVRAVIANSGNANCATGQRGLKDAAQMASDCASVLGIKPKEVLVASTGVIGRFLPMELMRQGIETVAEQLSGSGSRGAAEAILTTDHTVKETAVQFSVGGHQVCLGGIAKGAGMIAPEMATMLCFITTDAKVSKPVLQKALNQVTETTFNAVTIDGEMSTNDMVLVLANGKAGNPMIQFGSAAYREFTAGLEKVMEELAKMMVRDGEGATKFVEINVTGAKKREDAKKVAQRIANSLLVKTMLHGADPNWGRIAACVGSSGTAVRMNRVEITIGTILVFLKGEPVEHNREELKDILRGPEIQIGVDLGEGKSHFRIWTTDLSADYVKINAGYTS